MSPSFARLAAGLLVPTLAFAVLPLQAQSAAPAAVAAHRLAAGDVRLTDLVADPSGTTAFAGDLVVVTGTRNARKPVLAPAAAP